MFKKILNYLRCCHNWERIETVNYYKCEEDKMPSRKVIVFRCSNCGRVQKIKL